MRRLDERAKDVRDGGTPLVINHVEVTGDDLRFRVRKKSGRRYGSEQQYLGTILRRSFDRLPLHHFHSHSGKPI